VGHLARSRGADPNFFRAIGWQYGLDFPLIHGTAETIPYPDASFDFAISEYGACLWADPQRWVPEAARLLRPDGQLVFLTNSFLLTLCMPPEDGVAATERLFRSAFGIYRDEWPDNSSVEFHLAHDSQPSCLLNGQGNHCCAIQLT